MPSLSDFAAAADGPLAPVLAAGVSAISQGQTVTFTQYVRLVLPLDGFVFWVNANLIGLPSECLNGTPLNNAAINGASTLPGQPVVEIVPGSLHFSSTTMQEEDATYALNHVHFTTTQPVQALDGVSPTTLYIGTFNGERFAFRSQEHFYQQAGLFHYVGDALLPVFASQIIDNVAQLDTQNAVLTNSLPLFLALPAPAPLFPTNPAPVPIFPGYGVPDNYPAPYIVAHVVPDSTRALSAAPYIDGMWGLSQLCVDRVRLTSYGLRNFAAMDFLNSIFQYSLNTDNFGIMNMPVWRDEKRTASEMSLLAMKKTTEIEVSYYQMRANDIARQLITTCIPSFAYGGSP